jgi:hypothetical protein
MLRQVITSYLALSTRIEVVVHDNGSDDADTLAYLAELSGSGVHVTWGRKIRTPDDLNSVNETVRNFFGGLPKSRYVVTDCDVDMSIAAADALTIYGELLNQFPHASCVGPMLRIRDIPRDYPLFNWAMNRHIDQFWRHTPQWTETSVGRIAFLPAPVDTTFALHREGEDFRRLARGIRVYYPYEARHLDW